MQLRMLFEETRKQYLDRLLMQKIKKLGDGVRGVVFQHPTYPDVVVKVVSDDRLYMQWARFAMANKANPWVPKILSIHKVDLGGNQDYLVFMEKLEDSTYEDQKKAVQQILSTIPKRHLAKIKLRNYSYLSSLNPWWDTIAKYSADPHIAKMAALLFKFENGGMRHNLDLGINNMMMRGDQLVITDPVTPDN